LAPGLAFVSKSDDNHWNATGAAKFLCQKPILFGVVIDRNLILQSDTVRDFLGKLVMIQADAKCVTC
jgi:hypothetical protein